MDTDRTSAHLNTVQHDIISLGAHTSRIRINILYILIHGHGKWMVHGHIAVFLFRIFKQRELSYPKELKVILL